MAYGSIKRKTDATGDDICTKTISSKVAQVLALPDQVNIDVTPTLTVGGTAYATGDYVGTSGTAMTFAGAALANGQTGTIVGAELIDLAPANVPGELWMYDTAITPPADGAAWTLSDADAKRSVGVIPFNTYYNCGTVSSTSYGQVPNGGLPYTCGTASTSIYGCWVTRGAPNLANGDINIRLWVRPD